MNSSQQAMQPQTSGAVVSILEPPNPTPASLPLRTEQPKPFFLHRKLNPLPETAVHCTPKYSHQFLTQYISTYFRSCKISATLLRFWLQYLRCAIPVPQSRISIFCTNCSRAIAENLYTRQRRISAIYKLARTHRGDRSSCWEGRKWVPTAHSCFET